MSKLEEVNKLPGVYCRQENGEYIHQFDHWGDYLKYIDEVPFSEGAGRASETGAKDFTGTKSLQEAKDLARYGWKEGKEKLLKGKKELFDSSELFRVARYNKSVAGSFPSVPSYIANQPRSMYRRTRKETNIPILEIHVCPCSPHYVEQEAFMNYGGYMLNLIEEQENNGRRCELYVDYIATGFNGNNKVTSVKVKKSGEYVDIDFLSFSLAHPSSLRRLEFALYERSPFKDVVNKTQGYYGMAIEFRPNILSDNAIWLGQVEKNFTDKSKCVSEMDKRVLEELKRIGIVDD